VFKNTKMTATHQNNIMDIFEMLSTLQSQPQVSSDGEPVAADAM
jgi:hypothetical protein